MCPEAARCAGKGVDALGCCRRFCTMAHAVCRDIGKSCCLVTGKYTGASFLGSSCTDSSPCKYLSIHQRYAHSLRHVCLLRLSTAGWPPHMRQLPGMVSIMQLSPDTSHDCLQASRHYENTLPDPEHSMCWDNKCHARLNRYACSSSAQPCQHREQTPESTGTLPGAVGGVCRCPPG